MMEVGRDGRMWRERERKWSERDGEMNSEDEGGRDGVKRDKEKRCGR